MTKPKRTLMGQLVNRIGISRFDHAREHRADGIALRTEGGGQALIEGLQGLKSHNKENL